MKSILLAFIVSALGAAFVSVAASPPAQASGLCDYAPADWMKKACNGGCAQDDQFCNNVVNQGVPCVNKEFGPPDSMGNPTWIYSPPGCNTNLPMGGS